MELKSLYSYQRCNSCWLTWGFYNLGKGEELFRQDYTIHSLEAFKLQDAAVKYQFDIWIGVTDPANQG